MKLLLTAILCLTLTAQTQTKPSDLQLTLTQGPNPDDFSATIKNTSSHGLYLTLGTFLANTDFEMSAVNLTLTLPSGKAVTLTPLVSPGAGTIGIMDVPLLPGATYTFPIALHKFMGPEEDWPTLPSDKAPHLKPGRYRLQAELLGEDLRPTQDHHIPNWTGKIKSPEITFQIPTH
jgi:hypothetical protein